VLESFADGKISLSLAPQQQAVSHQQDGAGQAADCIE